MEESAWDKSRRDQMMRQIKLPKASGIAFYEAYLLAHQNHKLYAEYAKDRMFDVERWNQVQTLLERRLKECKESDDDVSIPYSLLNREFGEVLLAVDSAQFGID